jgi:hypothetical protein
VLFSEVQTPEDVPRPLDQAGLENVIFHVPANISAPEPFNFCVSNVKFLLGS